MSRAASPAGADRAPAAASPARRRAGLRFSRPLACQLLGLAAADLAGWAEAAHRETGLRAPASLGIADLVAIAVWREVASQDGVRFDDYWGGLAQIVAVLAAGPDIERLEGYVAVVGRDFARLAEAPSHPVRCVGGAFIVVPLGPILAELRDRVFS